MKYPKPTTTGVVKPAQPYANNPKSLKNPYASYDEGASQAGMYGAAPVTYESRPELYDVKDTSNWWDSDTYGNQTETLKKGLYQDGSAMNQNDLFQQQYGDSLVSETALRNAQIEDLQGFDYMGAGSLAMTGIGTAMQMGLYGDRKDYMSNTNAALEQNTQNAEESHNTRQANTASYGSAFSNA